jgi:hypothetical protein
MLIGEGQSRAGGVDATLGRPHVAASRKTGAAPTVHISIAVIAAGAGPRNLSTSLEAALSERYATSRGSNGQQKPVEPFESRARHSHSIGIR